LKDFNFNKTFIGCAIAFGCATRCHLSVHSLAHPRSGSSDDSREGSTVLGSPGGGSRGRRCSSGAVNHSEGGGVPLSALSLAGSAGHDLGADGCLDAFLGAACLCACRL